MFAAYAARISPEDPLSALEVGELAAPETPADWVTVEVRASALNHHDLWSLRGVGLGEDALPMVLGCDAAGVYDGRRVLVHSVIGEGEDETLDPRRTLLSEKWPGTLADTVRVPARNVIDLPDSISFTDAACLPTAWLTAYRMLTTRGRLPKGGSVLVQGAGGGVATAAVVLAHALGARVYATSRSAEKRAQIEALGAVALESGARLPERVDVVVETVGKATLDHSIKCTAPGGRIVVSGATSGHLATVDLRRVFFLQQEILGSTMGTRDELAALLDLVATAGIRPVIDSVRPFVEVRGAFEALASGEVFGKLVLEH
ncbi:Zn-dependent oxidoreductase [Longispora fulva]|uniref:NADPH:quinone reductase-like Zn-dependent oxidoreductase n=1 Tax=Longispora fulva TaxID=619741 RepID=A0A8J7GXI7_9ACTN|nr:zinc-binding dehydrogenase [Longispora fulva]MBG6140939.1 NADPH:quinone reductase-like Zn-dependent oxidoreductase [Longispora fulva]GIG60795.1 Zn-dependent oxidoreductase [Longispora fulva]